MDNTELKEKVLKYLKDKKVEVYDVKNVDGYFVFEGEKDSVIHFKIKGCKRWLFALWINSKSEGEYVVEFFTQHLDNIDKFKPTRSHFLVELTDDDVEDGYLYNVLSIVTMIKKHPIISFICDYRESEYIDFNIVPKYIEYKFDQYYYKAKRLAEEWLPYILMKSKLLICGKSKIINEIKITDGNGDGWRSCPRWTMRVEFKEDSTNEKESKWLQRWFYKGYVKNQRHLSIDLYRIGVDGSYYYPNEEVTK